MRDHAFNLADSRINPLYQVKDKLNIFKGFDYVPLNDVYRKEHSHVKSIRDKVGRVLVTLGGADTYGFTDEVVTYLEQLPLLATIKVVRGQAFFGGNLNSTDYRFEFAHSLSQEQMCKLMTEADLVICPCGLTVFEALCLGKPAIVVCAEEFQHSRPHGIASRNP